MTTSYGQNAGYIDALYDQYRNDPSSLSPAWQEFFEDYEPSASDREPEAEDRATESPNTAAKTNAAESSNASTAPTSTPSASGQTKTSDAPKPSKPASSAEPEFEQIRGAATRIVENMEQSVEVPTATTVRTVPVKLLEENRRLANQHQVAFARPKLSFTHFIAYAIVLATKKIPSMARGFVRQDGKPGRARPSGVHLGIAVDVERKDGSRMLFVPNIKKSETLDFAEFVRAFNDVVSRSRNGKITLDDFQGTGISITNPGMLGTSLSVPRLMAGQGTIVGIGSIAYPPHCSGMTPEAISELGLSKVMTITSTYDHRVIQGAESGQFLAEIERLLLGAEGFYDRIFENLGVPQQAVDWGAAPSNPAGSRVGADAIRQARVGQLIQAYRDRGHRMAHLDPLSKPPQADPELELYPYDLTLWDLDRTFYAHDVGGLGEFAKLRDILDRLRNAYSLYVGVELTHISDLERRQWLQRRVESGAEDSAITLEDKLHTLKKLNAAEAFELFVHKSYLGQKRFSLEGCEALVPVLDTLLEDAAQSGCEEIVMGMSHRGRLNVLVNVVGKSLTQVFQEFEDVDPQSTQGSGDVKYHLGSVGTFEGRSGGQVSVRLASNPSHLESVDPVVEGMARALQDKLGEGGDSKIVPVLIHGDAAFAGQGVVFETLNFAHLEGYATGGTVHVIANNQIGFTTDTEDARSTRYATDVAKCIEAPIFHVNADHPMAAVTAMRRAFAYRQEFKTDVVIDLIGYRKWGHNEADEPALTQPQMYERIRKHRSVRKLVLDRLLARGEIDVETGEKLLEEFQTSLQSALDEAKQIKIEQPEITVQPCLEHDEGIAGPDIETGVDRDSLQSVLEAITLLPDGFEAHPKAQRLLEQRQTMFANDKIDWGLAESLAYGSLLSDGQRIRLSGEDSGRGTFNHRHAKLVCTKSGADLVPLSNIAEKSGGKFEVYDSPLSEFGVLGFDYGYSTIADDALTIWEAQFGDFANGAQVIIDQYIASAEEKWNQKSAITLLLPHGYEGQGPEHSSARLERFLQLSSEGNIQVVYPTTAAQHFHLLRRQALQPERKPLIVMTPKSLLRLPAATARVEDLEQRHFDTIIDRPPEDPSAVTRVLIASGKICYDLERARSEQEAGNVAIVRLEQFYPFPVDRLHEVLSGYPAATEVVWVQEEPRNMGGWDFVDERLLSVLEPNQRLLVATRPWGASPATGSHSRHEAEQRLVVETALSGEPSPFPSMVSRVNA